MTEAQGSSQLRFMLSMFFIFSTFYGLAYFYYQGANQTMTTEGLEDIEDTTQQGIESGWLDYLLEAVSFLSPFALVKLIFLNTIPGDIYAVINIFLLRPIGWTGAWISTEWVINKIRGTSET